MSYDLLFSGGEVAGVGRADLAVRDGLVAAVGADLPGAARTTVDVTGLLITPGLVDLHTHVEIGRAHV